MERVTAIDFSYKDNAVNIEYDIESLESLFTVVFIHNTNVTLIFFGDDKYNNITDDMLIDVMKSYMSQPDHLSSFPEGTNGDTFQYDVIRAYTGDEQSIVNLNIALIRFLNCKPMTNDKLDALFVNYCGWNSNRYDLPLMALTHILITQMGSRTKPSDIRRLSDLIIQHEGTPASFRDYISEQTKGWLDISPQGIKSVINHALASDGHIDWARIAKLDDDDSKFPPGLKKEMARYGLDIVIDDLVAGEGDRNVTTQDILDLVYYNVNDVVGTRQIGMNDKIRGQLSSRDQLAKDYPHVSAKSVPVDKIGSWKIPERDGTLASFAGRIIRGPQHGDMFDNETVQFKFPVPDGGGGEKEVDLLDYMREQEEYMHPYLYAFFAHFRGKDTRRSYDMWTATQSQPITHSATMTCPYYRDGSPVDAYIQVSTGGAHGNVMSGLHKKSPEAVRSWIMSNVGALDAEKPTVDATNVIHLDWSSFYPTMGRKMKLYMTEDGVDRYKGIMDQRFEIKNSLPHDRSLWTPKNVEDDFRQDALKVVLNGATGAGNTHNKYALLPIDNKTLSMRLIGNMLIWCLAQRLTQAGGYIVSTNTDGLYMVGLDVETIETIVEDYVKIYGMPVEPEPVDRFINRDTSNRIEMLHGTIQQIRGRLRHGLHMYYQDEAVGKNVPYPLVTAHAAIKYITEKDDWLTSDYDKQYMVDTIHELYEESCKLPESKRAEAWYQIHVGSGSARLTVNGERQARINRVVLTREDVGDVLAVERRAALKKIECQQVWNMFYDGLELDEMSEKLGFEWAIDDGLDVSTLRFASKVDDPNGGNAKIAMPVDDQPNARLDDTDFDIYWKSTGASTIVCKNRKGEWCELKLWREGSITNYTTHSGVTLNTTKELAEFDMSHLDLDAYIEWAERLLSSWKITADVPEIGLVSRDDTVIPKKSGAKRETKAQKAIDMIDWLYDTSIKKIFDESNDYEEVS